MQPWYGEGPEVDILPLIRNDRVCSSGRNQNKTATCPSYLPDSGTGSPTVTLKQDGEKLTGHYSSATLDPRKVPPDRLAHGYRLEDGVWKEEPQLLDGAFACMGGMLTSIRDLSRYVAFLMSAWPPRDGPETGPIRRASAREMQQLWRSALATVTRAGPDAPLHLNAGGYGFGLWIRQTCEFGYVVAHGGGLPGFGSFMEWLPEYGVGVIAFGNLTYTDWSRVVEEALPALANTGGLQARVPRPARSLVEAREAVSRLIISWDDQLADSIAAVNLFLDESKERRRRQIEDLREQFGACRPEDAFDVENALRGAWNMTCAKGTLRVSISMAPTMPPKVQYLDVRPAPPQGTRSSTCPKYARRRKSGKQERFSPDRFD